MLKCERCNSKHYGLYGSGRFCSQKCARGASTAAKRKEINERVSGTLTQKAVDKFNRLPEDSKKKTCPNCKAEFLVSRKRLKKQYCSQKCCVHYKYDPRNPDYEANMEKARRSGVASAQSQKETRRSKNEIYFAELCQNKFSKILCNEAIFDGWDADVIIQELKIAVLWNGPWNRRKITKKHSVEQVQNRDKIKLGKIARAGYTSYIVDDDGKFNKKFVEDEFEKFLKFFKLSD